MSFPKASHTLAKYDAFHISHATYKVVASTPIDLSVLFPKRHKPGSSIPVILRWHGGFLVNGSRLYPGWFPTWLLEHAAAVGAVIVTPDYRLMPEATGLDILEDVRDVVLWLRDALPAALQPWNLTPDLQNVLVAGESAGGYLSAQTALLFGSLTPAVRFTVVTAAYGVLDLRSPFFTQAFPKNIMGAPPAPPDAVRDHMALVASGARPPVVCAADFPNRVQLALCLVQGGTYAKQLGERSELYPLDNVARVPRGAMPPVWAWHGRQDSAVPVDNSEAFVARVREVHPDADVLLTLRDGEHGFDAAATCETEWVREGLAFVGKYWPARRQLA